MQNTTPDENMSAFGTTTQMKTFKAMTLRCRRFQLHEWTQNFSISKCSQERSKGPSMMPTSSKRLWTSYRLVECSFFIKKVVLARAWVWLHEMFITQYNTVIIFMMKIATSWGVAQCVLNKVRYSTVWRWCASSFQASRLCYVSTDEDIN